MSRLVEQGKTRQVETTSYKLGQDEAIEDKARDETTQIRNGWANQNMTGQDRTGQGSARQARTRIGRTRNGKTRQSKTTHGKTRLTRATRQGKQTMQDVTR